MISTKGNAKALHFSPDFFTPLGPDFDRANFHVIVQTRARPRACFMASPYFYILDIHQLVMKRIAALVETTRDRAATVKSVSTVFSVPQQQRVPSAQLKSSAFKYMQ